MYTRVIIALCLLNLATVAFIGCSNGGNGSDSETDSQTDTESDSAATLPETDSDSFNPVSTDSAPGADTSTDRTADTLSDASSDSDTSTQTSGDSDASQNHTGNVTIKDYLSCDRDADCPVGFGSCIREIPLNRTGKDGVSFISVSDIFPQIEKSGVCTLTCTNSPGDCNTLMRPDGSGNSVPYTCQLIASTASPYPSAPSDFPFEQELDFFEMKAGVPYAAICRPPFELHPLVSDDFCNPCSGSEQCADGLCWQFFSKSEGTPESPGTCLMACGDGADCPAGFLCDSTFTDNGAFCRPVEDTCTGCRDLDEDGRGVGQCGGGSAYASSVDCDDFNKDAYYDSTDMTHAFPQHCGPFDYNCNGLSDEQEQTGADVFGEAHCGACYSECIGPVAHGISICAERDGIPQCTARCVLCEDCVDTDSTGICVDCVDSVKGWVDCDGKLETGCELSISDATSLYYADVDGDGLGDPLAPLFPQPVCGGDVMPGYVNNNDDVYDGDVTQTGADCINDELDGECRNGKWEWVSLGEETAFACVSINSPDAYETCDGLDNDCDGFIDEDATTGIYGDETVTVGASCGGCGNYYACQNGAVTCALSSNGDEVVGDGIDANCDGFDWDAVRTIFVMYGTATGTDGTKDNPFDNLSDAFAEAEARMDAGDAGVDIIVEAGMFNLDELAEPRLVDGVNIWGGYKKETAQGVNTWTAPATSGATATTILRTYRGGAVQKFTGISGHAIYSETVVSNVNISVEKENANLADGVSFYGMVCDECSGLVLTRVEITVCAANEGVKGDNGADGAGRQGTSDGQWDGRTPATADNKGATACARCTAGKGGDGGPNYDYSKGTVWPLVGTAGADGYLASSLNGKGGPAGVERGESGGNGGVGTNGKPDTYELHYPAQIRINFFDESAQYFWNGNSDEISHIQAPDSGTGGGVDGHDGGGAGGGATQYYWEGNGNLYYAFGGGGGSGGAGGQNGKSGKGGHVGGSSTGLVLLRSAGIDFESVKVTAGNGGAGGAGGDGGAGGNGGNGGNGGAGRVRPYTTEGGVDLKIVGGQGGYGGGGGGGAGGNPGPGGAGGDSIGALCDAISCSALIGSDSDTIEIDAAESGVAGKCGAPGKGGAPGKTAGVVSTNNAADGNTCSVPPASTQGMGCGVFMLRGDCQDEAVIGGGL